MLARLADARGASWNDLVRDIGPWLGSPGKTRPAQVRATLQAALRDIERQGGVAISGDRYELTGGGRAMATAALGASKLPKTWSEVRATWLVAAALGLDGAAASRAKALSRPAGLRAAVLEKEFGLASKGTLSPSRLRSALAARALERAFGGKIDLGAGRGNGLSAKAGRQLASQLLAAPRSFGTDGRLIAALAAEKAGSRRTDAESVRNALLARFVSGPPDAGAQVERIEATATTRAADAPPPNGVGTAPRRPAAALRPDLAGFARAVQDAARAKAEGWPGSRKAYIAHVWQAIHASHPEWGLSEIEFKGMLAEAHRTGHVVLANADLKNKQRLADVERSALVYKNAVLHFVRVED